MGDVRGRNLDYARPRIQSHPMGSLFVDWQLAGSALVLVVCLARERSVSRMGRENRHRVLWPRRRYYGDARSP